MGAPIHRTSEKVTLRSGGLGTRLSPKFDRNLTAIGCLSLSLKESKTLIKALFCLPVSSSVPPRP